MKRDEKRAVLRYPYGSRVSYTDLGHPVHPLDKAEFTAEILDLSNAGMRMRTKGSALGNGTVLRVRISVPETQAAVPTLAQVIWTKQEKDDVCHVGLKFVVQ